jgi:hypothetical protein
MYMAYGPWYGHVVIAPRAGAKPRPFFRPFETLYQHKYNIFQIHNKNYRPPRWLARRCESVRRPEVTGSTPGHAKPFYIYKTNEPIMGCHVAALDWATWHPYQPIRTCHVSACHWPTCVPSQPCHVDRRTATLLPRQLAVRPVIPRVLPRQRATSSDDVSLPRVTL